MSLPGFAQTRAFIHRLLATAIAILDVLIISLVAGLVIAWHMGLTLLWVTTSSMEPAVTQNSLVVIQPAEVEEVAVGDLISYRGVEEPVAHALRRVVGVSRDVEGRPVFQTKADGHSTPDPLFVPGERVDGRARLHVPYAGIAAASLRPPLGTLILGGVPLFLLAAMELRQRFARVCEPS